MSILRDRCGVIVGLAAILALGVASTGWAEVTADDVLAVVRANDDSRLRALVEDVWTEEWSVAYEVARHDRSAALRFARASTLSDADKLKAYLDARKSEPSANMLEALRLAKADEIPVSSIPAFDAALPKADAFEGARLHLARGRALGWPKGRDDFDRALALAERLGWANGVSLSLHWAGRSAVEVGDLSEAAARWNKRLLAEDRRGPKAERAMLLNNLAGLAVYLGDYQTAIDRLQGLTTELVRKPDPEFSLAEVHMNLAYVHDLRGEFRSALRETLAAVDSVDRDTKPEGWAEAQVELAGAYIEVGQYEEALQSVERSEAALKGIDTDSAKRILAKAQGFSGRALMFLREFEDALESLKAAREYFESQDDTEFVVNTLTHLTMVYQEMGRHEDAIRHAQEGLERAPTSRPWVIADLQDMLAHSHTRAGRLDEAWKLSEKSIPAAKTVGSRMLLRDCYLSRAEILMARKDYVGVEEACDLAYQELAAMVLGLPEGTNATARATHAAVFDMALEAAAKRKDAGAFFRWVERTRSGALLESITDRAKVQQAVIPQELRNEERAARDREVKTEQDLRESHQDPSVTRKQRRALRRMLADARTHLRTVRTKIQLARKAASDLFYPKGDTLEVAQKRLQSDQAMVAYTLSKERARALLVLSDAARIVDLGPASVVVEAAQAAMQCSKPHVKLGALPTSRGLELETDGGAAKGDIEGPLVTWRKLLIEPLGLDQSITSLIIMPDGALYSMPFAVVDPTRTITYAPSATTLGALRREETGGREGILALGDPDYTGRKLAPLPGTKTEVEAIGRGHTILLGKQAGEVALRAALTKRSRWRALHLACHGIIDTSYPLNSSLELSLQPKSDGRLTAAEVFDLPLECDLAVLSACQTGRGTVVKSEGLLGLTRSFMVAGAPRVICSLWKVDDKATSALMVEFYRLWNAKSGTRPSAAEALRKAQEHVRTLKKNGKHPWAHPYYWAAWSLWGLPD